MKIAVISDTHMPKRAKQLPKGLVDGITGVDLIIHAGDWSTIEIVEKLKEIAPVDGVYGNVDSPEILELFEERKILQLHGKRLGIVHGHFGKKRTTPERAIEAFQNENLDVIIFGHSHIPYKKKHGNILLFNPGSPTDKRVQKRYSYGIMEINETISTEHYYYSDRS